jgi:hypothetical protein
MKKHNLFSHIWSKAYKRGTNPTKLADDMGGLKGYFQFKQYDPKTGLIIAESGKFNTLTNQSKSNLIRLISQGQSNWIGNVDPATLKIQKMRFGNANDFVLPSKLNYYNLSETSTRANNPKDAIFAGGKSGAISIPGASATVDTISNAFASNYEIGPTIDGQQSKIYTIPSLQSNATKNPPSHGTLKVEFKLAGVLVETLSLGIENSEVYIYTRSKVGIYPTLISNPLGQQPINNPGATLGDTLRNGTEGFLETIVDSINETLCNTRLFYDYSTNNEGWKLKVLTRDQAVQYYDSIVFTYEIGKFNIINSIIPRVGYNAGSGNSELTRYQGNQDFYQILSGVEYADASDDFIDDYSVTFSCNMSSNCGNGETTALDNIQYTEAFLFDAVDNMFSIVYLPSSFDKNSESAFLISWTILAPIS